jgi:hypothetical protein
VFLDKRLDELKNRELLKFNTQSVATTASKNVHIPACEHNPGRDGGAERVSSEHSAVTDADRYKSSFVEPDKTMQNEALQDGG